MGCAATTTIREALAELALVRGHKARMRSPHSEADEISCRCGYVASAEDYDKARRQLADHLRRAENKAESDAAATPDETAAVASLEQLVEAAQAALKAQTEGDRGTMAALAAAVAAVGPGQETDEVEIDLQPSPEGHGDATSPGYYPDAAVGPGEEPAQ